VAQDWRALQYASAALKADRDVVLAAVAQDWRARSASSPRATAAALRY
jgi:hypothetical protein